MRFKKKPQYRTIVVGTIIVLTAVLVSHFSMIHFWWPAILMGSGIVLFFHSFLQNRKPQKRIRIIQRKTEHK